ncbi:MAG: DNA-processing protein DprA [Oscillospiraceae bacterium]|nr:DNA-processing protein DprA [Oscillospiraceae bacterium]
MSEEYWIWLQLVLGFSSIKLPYIINHFGNAKTFYEASESDKIRYSFLNENEIKRLHSVPRKYVNDIINECNESNINIITPDSPLYPQRVLNIDNPPAVLYCKGEMPKIDSEVVVTIVGPRKPSEFGKRYGFKVSYSLALAGCIIVSGGAIGIDSMAHYGAIESGGKTVAVLGCGINNNYLLANENLREKISCNGCLLSEYPPQMNASKYSFPQRNRLLSALGLCTVVIEAGEKSGTLITANCAAEQGRDVFVVPGNPSSPQYKGSNKLINDGAKLLLSPATVLEEYIDKFNINYDENLDTEAQSDNLVEKYLSNTVPLRKEQKQETKVIEELKKQELDESLSETAATIYKSILKKHFSAEDIISQTGIDLELVILAITELEINGLARALPGGMYSLL